MLSNKDDLILQMVEDYKHLEKEVICLRYALIRDYPSLKDELLNDLTPSFIFNKEYLKLCERLNFDPYEDDEINNSEIDEIINKGYTASGYPFSI